MPRSRNRSIIIRLTDEEYELVEQRARSEGRNRADMIRFMFSQPTVTLNDQLTAKPEPPDPMAPLFSEPPDWSYAPSPEDISRLDEIAARDHIDREEAARRALWHGLRALAEHEDQCA